MSAKLGLVIGGYLLAIVAAVAAAWLYDVRMAAMPYDTSGGMYAGGQMLQSLAAFLVVALAPTLLGLWFLRRHTGFWNGVAIASLAFAAAGLVAVLTMLVFRQTGANPALMLVSLVGLSQLLGVPLWAAAFGLFAVIAPTRGARTRLMVAVAIEAVIGVFALAHWFGPRSPL